MDNTKRHIGLLDQVRGAAIMAVLLTHSMGVAFGMESLPWDGLFRKFDRLELFVWFLPISILVAGVPIFFVVSGFCIHLSFHQQKTRWREFFIRRFFRIYPAYIAAILLIFLIKACFYGESLGSQVLSMQFVTHFFLVHNCASSYFWGINESFWSLAIEAQLYLIYPLLLWLVAMKGWRTTLWTLAGLEILLRIASSFCQTLGVSGTVYGQVFSTLASSPFGYWCSWSLGAFIADCYLKKNPLPWQKTSPKLFLVLATLCYFFRPLESLRFLLLSAATAVLLSHLLNRNHAEISSMKVTGLKFLGKIGIWSYSIYLLHQPLISLFFMLVNFSFHVVWLYPPIAFLLNCLSWVVVIPFCVLPYEVFEVTGISFGKKLLQKADTFRRVVASLINKRLILSAGALSVVVALFLLFGLKFNGMKYVIACNNSAWSLATNPDASKRNGILAVKMGEDACENTKYHVTLFVGTLAAAYAEAGRFDRAISTAQIACQLAEKNGETNLLQSNKELLELYKTHQAYHEKN